MIPSPAAKNNRLFRASSSGASFSLPSGRGNKKGAAPQARSVPGILIRSVQGFTTLTGSPAKNAFTFATVVSMIRRRLSFGAQEPVDPANPLLTLDNVIIYPHIGGNTTEAAHRASYFSAMGVQEVYEGKKPTWPINDVDYATAKTYDDVKKPDRKPAGMFEY